MGKRPTWFSLTADSTRHYGLYVWSFFALRSGQEHRQRTMEQIRVVEKPGAPAYVVYTDTHQRITVVGYSSAS